MMQAIWISMKGNVKCVCKHSVDVLNPVEGLKRDRRLSSESSIDRRSEHKNREEPRRRSSEHRDAKTSTHFIELSKGDTSRNIVEMIYQTAARDVENTMQVISQVFKVENSVEMHKRFEKHREAIKKIASEKKNQHPRVLVDGNELIQFYSTSMSCNGINNFCNELSCGVCTTLQTEFRMDGEEKKGIVCSMMLKEAKGGMHGNVRRCVIVCRTIVGLMGHMNDESIEGCDSIHSAAGSKLDYLIVQSPKAFLPCFVIVFDK